MLGAKWKGICELTIWSSKYGFVFRSRFHKVGLHKKAEKVITRTSLKNLGLLLAHKNPKPDTDFTAGDLHREFLLICGALNFIITNKDNIFSCLFHIKHFHVSLMYLRFKIGFELSSVTEYWLNHHSLKTVHCFLIAYLFRKLRPKTFFDIHEWEANKWGKWKKTLNARSSKGGKKDGKLKDFLRRGR